PFKNINNSLTKHTPADKPLIWCDSLCANTGHRIKINVRQFLFACKVLEFLGQKKAKGQIPALARPPEEPQFKTESQA
ncbi:hypothetical protein, partial [Brucella abortus]|uniref:hypothetical protein n=1 Tax=Brucella abortus TaxID=235 RepID=UPI0034509BB4